MKNRWGSFIKIIILILLLLGVIGLRHLYQVDSENLEKARLVLKDIVSECTRDGLYPEKETFQGILKSRGIQNTNEWYLYTSPGRQTSRLQYPMSLPILWAPGKAKISEFIPTIYAFIVVNPCEKVISPK
ncbi:MAG: hypothetical protein K9K67_07970 [Bacteriovoracaceae bacterium]|nr:hypothetical protein [Bacteriovoracaceae bacterium]